MQIIHDTDGLARLCQKLAEADFITVDTEFMRDATYWPKLCLVQLAGPDEAAAIDVLAPGLDLSALFDLLADPGVLKVFHAARQDIEIFVHLSGAVPHPLFDTQVAAMVLGYGDQVGYETLVNKVARKQIDKSMRFTDWSHRPLSDKQLAYALSDVTHLRQIYATFARRLAENGRAHWLAEEMERLTDRRLYETDPADAWKRLKTRSAKPRFLAVARALAYWREEEAQRKDLPRNRIMRDDTLLDIAARHPTTDDDLNRTRGVSRQFAASRPGKAVLEAVRAAMALPADALPKPVAKRDWPQGLGPVVELLKVLLKLRCEEAGVAQRLVAATDDLYAIAAGETDGVAALGGWRAELFGDAALKLIRGEIALRLDGMRVEVVALESAG